jgi:hypothetical protein
MPKTKFVAEPGAAAVVMTRVFNAPRELGWVPLKIQSVATRPRWIVASSGCWRGSSSRLTLVARWHTFG